MIFDWQKNGWTDHIGFVEQVNGNQMVTIEGNTSRVVARPEYSVVETVAVGKKSVVEIAGEVVAGKWGNGDERVLRLKRAGYDAGAVQKSESAGSEEVL